MREIYDEDALVIAEKRGFSIAADLVGKTIEVCRPDESPIVGQVIEAYEDAKGVITLVKMMWEDGSVSWQDVRDGVVFILPLFTRWVLPLWRLIRGRMQRRRLRRKARKNNSER